MRATSNSIAQCMPTCLHMRDDAAIGILFAANPTLGGTTIAGLPADLVLNRVHESTPTRKQFVDALETLTGPIVDPVEFGGGVQLHAGGAPVDCDRFSAGLCMEPR